MQYDIALAGLVVGTLIGLTGIGGGSLLTPALILIFGINPLTAVGSDLFFNAVTKIFGSAQHGRQGTINYRLAFTLALGSVPAALAGVGVVTLLKASEVDADQVVKRLLGGTLVLSGGLMLFRPFLPRQLRSSRGGGLVSTLHARRRAAILLGASAGFLVGMTSIGSGALLVPVLTLLYPLSASQIVGTDVFHAMMLSSVAGLAHWGAGNIDWALTGNLLMGSVPGVVFGSRLAVIAPDRIMRTALGVLVLFSGIRLL